MSQNRIFPIFLDQPAFSSTATTGFLPLNTSYVFLGGNTAAAWGLSAGEIPGQCMNVVNLAGAVSRTLVIQSPLTAGTDSIVLGSTGANALLMWNNTNWVVLSTNGTLV